MQSWPRGKSPIIDMAESCGDKIMIISANTLKTPLRRQRKKHSLKCRMYT